ncbi:pPIWI_RE module domain-containing protein [Streptomyces sp. NPDC091368]|uniref:pPIWI_RE module domain-containing protein n=1 Tax=Streptomyces sp. NPDC091368 TaxID=3365993 RepID=UPI0038167B8E
MARPYDSIHTAAARPVSIEASAVERYRALPFPEEWTSALLTLCNAGRDKPLETVPTFRMDQVVQALAPDVLVRPRPNRARGDSRDFWLYVPEDVPDPLPDAALKGLFGAWLKDLRPEPEYRALLSETRSVLLERPPRWQEDVSVELLRYERPTDGGTAAPDSRQFQLATDWLARRILALEPYDYGGGRLRFRAMPRGPMDRGAELVSQALEFEGFRGTEWYSVVINITLHTVPFDPLPRFHVHTHIRRYASRVSAKIGRLFLPFGRKTTVLLRPRVPWLPGAPASDRFAVARLAWSQDGYDWAGGGPAGMLRGMSLREAFPDAEAILTDPAAWLKDDMRAAVLYSTAMGSHEVGPGLMTNQRSKIVEWAVQALPDQLRPVPALVRTRLSGSAPANPRREPSKEPAKTEAECVRAEARRVGAAYALRQMSQPLGAGEVPILETRLLWQTAEMRDTAIAALVAHLDLKGDGGVPTSADAYDGTVDLEWQSPELTVRLRCRRLTHDLGQDLALPEGSRHSREAVTIAIRDRRREVTAFLAKDDAQAPAGTASLPTLALVEIDRAKDFTSGDHDAKFALRLGCADAGVLTQFMAVPKKAKGYNSEKNKEFRAAKAWDDGLRQLGVRVHPEHSLGDQLPEGMRYAAVWMVRKNRRSRTRWAGYVPVAVLVTPDPSGTGLARVEGWDDEARAWVPYPVMLLRLTKRAEVPTGTVPVPRDGEAPVARLSWWADMTEQRQATEEWLQRVRRTLRGTPTLLLAHGQNMRSHWTWLQDGTVVVDKFRDGHAPARRLDPDLRLVRVRTARNRETAQWWAMNPDGANGLAAHLWTDPTADAESARVFWSTTPKARTFKLSVAADKLAPRVNSKGNVTVDTDKAAWNPGLVELAVLGCHPGDGDVPEALALAVHQLRQAPDLPDALSLPLPLHLAGLAQEYVLPTRNEDDEDTAGSGADATADADPDRAAAPGVETAPGPEQLTLDIPLQPRPAEENRGAEPR